MAGMSGTVGDTYQISAFQADGITPISTAGLASQIVAIRDQVGNVANIITSNSGNVFSFVTTSTTFATGGPYYLQLILTYGGGIITKGQIIPITINQSNE